MLFLFLSLLLFVFTLMISISLSLHWPRFLPLPCSSDRSLLHVISFAFIFTLSLCIIYFPSLLSTVFNALNVWPFYTIMIHRLTQSLRFVIAFFLLTVLSVCFHHCCYWAIHFYITTLPSISIYTLPLMNLTLSTHCLYSLCLFCRSSKPPKAWSLFLPSFFTQMSSYSFLAVPSSSFLTACSLLCLFLSLSSLSADLSVLTLFSQSFLTTSSLSALPLSFLPQLV